MSFFCLLWVPFFYLFRRCYSGEGGSGGVWALILGSVTAVIQFFQGNFVTPGGFGFSRWLFGFIDIVSLPVLIPIVLYALMLLLRGFSGADFANFTLLWLIPIAVLRTISWSAHYDPILLVIVPVLWTALAVGIPFLINWMANNFRWYIAVIAILSILILPVAAAGSYWAFFSQQTLYGFLMFFAVLIPAGISLTLDILGAS